MAIRGLTDSSFKGDAHVWGFTVANIDLTGREVELALALINPQTGGFDFGDPVLVKNNGTPGHMTDVDLPNGQIDVNLDSTDTDESQTVIGAGQYQFQLRVLDATPVVVSEGVHILHSTIVTP